MEKSGNISYQILEEILGKLNPVDKSGAYGVHCRILLGYLMYKKEKFIEGGKQIIAGMRVLEKRKYRICPMPDKKRICSRFYIMDAAGGHLQEGIYHLTAECFGKFGMYIWNRRRNSLEDKESQGMRCIASSCAASQSYKRGASFYAVGG